ncbi:MAG: helix-turn-helix transcriptional regulator [Chitinophagaceae bacterium]|nr:helix-turn-helix transcriptional regulator [Chitinophagaceae bacterium]
MNTSWKLKSSVTNNKALMLNGSSAIQSCTCNEYQHGSIFLEENTLLLLKEGIFKIRYGNTEYRIYKNQIVFLKKDILIYYETESHADHPINIEYLIFSLKDELVKEFTKLSELSMVYERESTAVTVNTVDARLSKYVDSLEFYLIEPERMEASLIKIKLLELLFCLTGNNQKILGQLLDLRDHFRSNITTTVEENILNSLSLNQLAVLSGRSLSSFRRDFLAIYNMPPSQWIRQKRLEKAQELLLNTTMKVTDVCYTIGFENIAHFSRLFKSRFRYSPSEFRMNTHVA